MQDGNTNTRSLTLADIFLMMLEKMAQDEEKKAYIRKVRMLMDVPECAEFLSCCVINAMGIPTPIAASNINKAFDCLIHFYEDNIEENSQILPEQKDAQKVLMRVFMSGYRIAVINFMASQYLLK